MVVITDERLAGERGLTYVLEAALRGGAPSIQIRAKDADAGELFALATRVGPIVRAAGALLVVNDRFDVALGCGADGVHLGPDDVPVAYARRTAPAGFLIGFSTDAPVRAQQAVNDGADYIGCGTVYATANKPGAGPPIGLERLREVVEAVDVPVLGIGGVAAEHATEVAATGAAGCAVIGSVMAAPDPEATVRALLAPFKHGG